jgi:hypothetical protein
MFVSLTREAKKKSFVNAHQHGGYDVTWTRRLNIVGAGSSSSSLSVLKKHWRRRLSESSRASNASVYSCERRDEPFKNIII